METPERYRRVRSVFERVYGLLEPQRSAELRRLCGDDDELRADVETLLRHDSAPDRRLDDPAPQRFVARDAALTWSRRVTALAGADGAIPRRIGDYEIEERLSEGGMAVVYRARQPLVERIVALKVLRSPLAGPEEVARFRREAQILGELDHPGIARIWEAGTWDTGYGEQPFLAMELVDGVPLHEYLATERPDLRARLAMFARICDAVQHAHDHGVVHRDLKPTNVLVEATGDPRVIDFGVARIEAADQARLTGGGLVGTPQYMSPEQVRGDRRIDGRSDVYSLGLMLYEAIAGRLPYELGDRSTPEILHTICEEPVAELSAAAPGIDRDLDAIVLTALEKSRADRYASPAELAADLRRYLRGEPVRARPVGVLRRALKWARRRPARAAGLLGAALVVSAGIALGVAGLLEAVAATRRALGSWTRGDLVATHRELEHVPEALAFLLPAELRRADSPGGAQQAPEEPLARVFEHLDRGELTGAWLAAARYLEADGPAAHPRLAAFLASGIASHEGPGRRARRLDALRTTARLFFDHPCLDRPDFLAAERFRRRLHELPFATLDPLERMFALTALYGCGSAASLTRIDRWLLGLRDASASGAGSDTLLYRAETLRLALVACASIVARSDACGYADRLLALDLDALLERLARRVRARRGEIYHEQLADTLLTLFVSVACARVRNHAARGRADVGAERSRRLIVRAARRDPELVARLRTDPTTVFDALVGAAPGDRHFYWYGYVLRVSGYLASPKDHDAHVTRLAARLGLPGSVALDEFHKGCRMADVDLAGPRTDQLPDPDTRLGHALREPPAAWVEIEPLEHAAGDDEVLVAWDFSMRRDRVAGGGTARGRRFDPGTAEQAKDGHYRRLANTSRAELFFQLDPPTLARCGDLVLYVDAQKALRRPYPFGGSATLELHLDGAPLARLPVQSTAIPRHEIVLSAGRLGPGRHRLELRLTPSSTTTVRIYRLGLRRG